MDYVESLALMRLGQLEDENRELNYQFTAERMRAEASQRRVDELRLELDQLRADRDSSVSVLETEFDDLGEEIDDLRTCIGWHEKFLLERDLLAEFHRWFAKKQE